MLLVVGLGNPGPEYARHRHNIGFMAVDAIVDRHEFAPFRPRFDGRAAEGRLGGVRAVCLKPSTYMNESGRSVAAAMRFYKLESAQVIAIHDEVDLMPGRCKVKQGGGNAGHNGLRSLDAYIGREYWRVRLGVGHPGDKDRVPDYVLHDFAKADRLWLEPLIEAVADAFPLLAKSDAAGFMNRVALATQPPKAAKPKPERPPPGRA
ncbi:MAG TPA: aminoacyl-tRNA hydrolase [Alphaproteobacteria bacterium]|nr:aminoacyl-tRNA hydrolase [Alphaproteobacteria bacterium]